MPHKHRFKFMRPTIFYKGWYIFECKESDCRLTKIVSFKDFWGRPYA